MKEPWVHKILHSDEKQSLNTTERNRRVVQTVQYRSSVQYRKKDVS